MRVGFRQSRRRNLLSSRFRDFRSDMTEATGCRWRVGDRPAVASRPRSRNRWIFRFQHFKCDSVVYSTHRDFKYEWVEHCLLPGSSAGGPARDFTSRSRGRVSKVTRCATGHLNRATPPPTCSRARLTGGSVPRFRQRLKGCDFNSDLGTTQQIQHCLSSRFTLFGGLLY